MGIITAAQAAKQTHDYYEPARDLYAVVAQKIDNASRNGHFLVQIEIAKTFYNTAPGIEQHLISLGYKIKTAHTKNVVLVTVNW